MIFWKWWRCFLSRYGLSPVPSTSCLRLSPLLTHLLFSCSEFLCFFICWCWPWQHPCEVLWSLYANDTRNDWVDANTRMSWYVLLLHPEFHFSSQHITFRMSLTHCLCFFPTDPLSALKSIEIRFSKVLCNIARYSAVINDLKKNDGILNLLKCGLDLSPPLLNFSTLCFSLIFLWKIIFFFRYQ